MKKWYLLNLLLFLATFALGQNIEFDTLNFPVYSVTDDFKINSKGHVFTTVNKYSNDGGTTWSTPPWGQPKTKLESQCYYNVVGSLLLKYNIEDFSIDTLPYFSSQSRGAGRGNFTDGAGNTFSGNNRDEIYIFPHDGNDWQVIQSFWQNSPDLKLNSIKVFKNSSYLFYEYEDKIYRCNKYDGSNLQEVDFLPTNEHQSGNLILEQDDQYYYSEDDGLSWLSFQNMPLPPSEVASFNSHDSGRIILVTEDSLIYVSDDFAQTWDIKSIGNHNMTLHSKIGFSESTNEYYLKAFANDSTNLFRFSGDFQSYQSLYPDTVRIGVRSIEEDYLGNIYLETIPIFSRPNTYYRSTDQGKTFSLYTIDGHASIGDIYVLNKSAVLFASVGFDRIYKSIDMGESWVFNHTGNTMSVGYDDQLCIKERNVTKHFSYDKGNTWESYDIEGTFMPDGNCYSLKQNPSAHLSYTLIKQTPGSQIVDSLYTFPNGYSPSMSYFFISEKGTLFIYSTYLIFDPFQSFRYVMVSNDNGKTFSIYDDSNFSNPLSDWNSFKGKIYQEGFLGLHISEDEGLTWGEFSPNYTLSKTVLKNGTLYLGKAYTGLVLRSKTPIVNLNSIKGKVFLDSNKNCLEEVDEKPLSNAIVELSIDGKSTFASTQEDGKFLFFVIEGDYDVSAHYNSQYAEICDAQRSISFAGINEEAVIDFPIKFIKECSDLSVDLSTPRIRRCFSNTHYVQVSNQGLLISDSTYVQIDIDPRFEVESATIPWSIDNEGLYNFFVGEVSIFNDKQFHFTTTHACDSVQLMETICMEAQVFPNDGCGEMADWQGPTLKVDGYCDGDSLRFKVKNIGDDDMTQARQYIIIEDVAIMRIGDPFQLP